MLKEVGLWELFRASLGWGKSGMTAGVVRMIVEKLRKGEAKIVNGRILYFDEEAFFKQPFIAGSGRDYSKVKDRLADEAAWKQTAENMAARGEPELDCDEFSAMMAAEGLTAEEVAEGEETDEDAEAYFREKKENSRAALLDRITELEEALREAKKLFDAAKFLLRKEGRFFDGSETWMSHGDLVGVMRLVGYVGRAVDGSTKFSVLALADMLEAKAVQLRRMHGR